MLILSNIENSSTLSIYTSNNKESINNALDELIKFHYAIFSNEEILEAHPYPYEDKDKPVKIFTTSER